MKGAINQQWLHLTSFDSGAPTGGAAVIHRFDTPGEYRVRFVHGEETLAQTVVAVGGQAAETAPGPGHVTLDLKTFARPASLGSTPPDRQRLVVRPQGYVSFTDSGQAKPFSVVAEAASGDGPGFDSRRLGPGDIFALTLLRPGKYSLVNELARSKGEITVEYPVVGKVPYRPPDPLSVDCTDRGFQPADITLKPAQGLIIHVKTAARIKIELTQPDDGPDGEPGPRASISREDVTRALERVRDARNAKKK
jgi:hypothetical protein